MEMWLNDGFDEQESGCAWTYISSGRSSNNTGRAEISGKRDRGHAHGRYEQARL